MLNRLIRLFLYCGVPKDEYNSVKKDAYVSNFRVWKYLHLFIGIAFAALYADNILQSGLTLNSFIRLGMLCYSAAVFYLFSGHVKEDSLAGQLIIYLTMVLLLLITFWLGIRRPDMMAVSFIVMLVLLPMFMIDKPYFMAIVIILSGSIYLFHAKICKSDDVFRGDVINVIAYGLLGIIINAFYNSIRIKEFLLIKKNAEQLVNLNKSMAETEKLSVAMQRMSQALIDVLGDVVEGRDVNSGDHIRRVKGYTNILANRVMKDLPEYGLDDYTVKLMTFTSSLHDVGKISIPDSILLKPGRLTKEEFEIMKTHCEKGCEVLEKMSNHWDREYLDMGLTICRSHHEKWDGNGYPDGLKGDEIPIAAQIVSLADIYDALTTKRVYKDAYSHDMAFEMILKGECGVFSEKLLSCFKSCRDDFRNHAENPGALALPVPKFAVSGKGHSMDDGFVIGIHDDSRTLQEKLRLGEELNVISSLSEDFLYVCYVNQATNEVYRFKADARLASIADSVGKELPSNEKLDRLLNTIIVSEDYGDFRKATDRVSALAELRRNGYISVSFRIRLEDGIHHCRMRMVTDPNNRNDVIIGIMNVDDEHRQELEAIRLQQELEAAKLEMKNREQLQDQLAVINCVSREYDYVCSLNAETMDVTVYRAEPWIRDMFKNLEDIVVSPDVRDRVLKGIVHQDDFARFAAGSMHENVMKGLVTGKGSYHVDYRAYKYGRLIPYQTNYTLDPNDSKRIIIGLRSLEDYVSACSPSLIPTT